MPQRRHRADKVQPTRSYSKNQESKIAETFGGSRTKNSGATAFQKGDVLLDQFLIEAKTKVTPSESITLQKSWFEKNEKESLFMGKPYNALVFNFGPNEKNHYVIDEYLFQTLIDALSKGEN